MDNTILIVDADPETEEKIVSTLEAENYLVFAATGQYFSGEMLERTTPSLIFLKPASVSLEGFQTCKTIHNMDAFKNVPIVALASLKSPLDSRYTTFYGIADFLQIPLDPRDVIEKTEKILGGRFSAVETVEEGSAVSEENHQEDEPARLRDTHSVYSRPGDNSPALNESADDFEPAKEAAISAEGTLGIQDYDALDTGEDEISENVQPNEEEAFREEQDNLRENLFNGKPNKQGLLIPVVIAISAIVIVAAGFLFYFVVVAPKDKSVAMVPPRTVQPGETTILPLPAQQQQEQPLPDAEPEGTQKVPEKASAIVPEDKSLSNAVYSVQVGAFKSKVAADSLAKHYKGRGYRAVTRRGTTKDNQEVYRVLIGHYENRKEALDSADTIQTREKINTIIFAGQTH
jgi:cell division septation protein DedD